MAKIALFKAGNLETASGPKASVSVPNDGRVTFLVIGAGTGRWRAHVAFAEVLNGVVLRRWDAFATDAEPIVSLLLDSNNGTLAGWLVEGEGTFAVGGFADAAEGAAAIAMHDMGAFAGAVDLESTPKAYLALGARASVNGVQYTYGAGGWGEAVGGSSSPASPTAIGGVYSKTAPVAVSTLAAILATTPAVGTVGLPSDSVGSQMEYGPLGWDGYFGLYPGGMPAVLALPTTNIAYGARIKCARAGFNTFSWQGALPGWVLGEVGSAQLVAQGPPQIYQISVAQAGTEAVAGKTYCFQTSAIPASWDAVRAVFLNRSTSGPVTIDKAMAVVAQDQSSFGGTLNVRAFLKFGGSFAAVIPAATQVDNNASCLAGLAATDLLLFPQDAKTSNRMLDIRAYYNASSGNNNNPLTIVQDASLGPYSYNQATGDKLTAFAAITMTSGYYGSMHIPVFYKFMSQIHVSAVIFGDSIAVGQTTTNQWRSMVTIALRALGVPHMQYACSGQTSAGTYGVMQQILPFLASINALPTHAIIWAYSPNDSGSDGSPSSSSWSIFRQKLALLSRFGITPICIGPTPFGTKTTLKPMGDLLVSDYDGYSPFMDNSVDGVNWIAANTNDNVHPNDEGVAASIAAGFQAWLAGKLV